MYGLNKVDCKEQTLAGSAIGIDHQAPTISENIDRRIAYHQREIESLLKVKEQLAQPNGLLNIRIDDLRNAMNF